MNPIPNQTNIRTADLVARADGSPIVDGDVYYFLLALTGANAGKWWAVDEWVDNETGNLMVHISDGHWYVNIQAEAWEDAAEYLEFVWESGNLHIPYSNQIQCEYLADVKRLLGTELTATDVRWPAAALMKLLNVETPSLTVESVNQSGDSFVAVDANLDAKVSDVKGAVDAGIARLEADVTVDTTKTPWELVVKQKGTATVLFRKKLTQADGSNVTSADHLVGNQVHVE